MNNDEKCVLNVEGNKCEIQKCSEQNENNCNSFISNDKSKKCVKVDDRCELKSKQCSDFSVNECYYYDIDLLEEDENNPNSCIPNSNNDGCELKHCEDLNPNECSKFKPIYEDELQCISRGTKCELVPCQYLTNTECSNFITSNLDYKCIPGETLCIEKKKECSELPASYCRSPLYEDNGDQCILNNDGTGCIIKVKSKTENPDQNTGNNEGSNTGNNEGSNISSNSSNSKEEKESENDSKNSSNIMVCFVIKFLLFLLF